MTAKQRTPREKRLEEIEQELKPYKKTREQRLKEIDQELKPYRPKGGKKPKP